MGMGGEQEMIAFLPLDRRTQFLYEIAMNIRQ